MASSRTRTYEIEEDKNLQNGSTDINSLMSPEQRKRGQYYRTAYHTRKAEVEQKYKPNWDYLCRLYECKRDPVADDESAPSNFIPVVTPTVEGQVASMMESNIEFRHITNNPGHEVYMKQLDAASEYYRKKINFKQYLKDFARYYDLLGNCWVEISWQKSFSKSASSPSGMPKITIPPLATVLVDGRIKDTKDVQNAEYIIIVRGFVSIAWIRKEYGDEYGDAVSIVRDNYQGTDPDINYDDTYSTTLLNVYTRSNEYGNLQLIEMDANGLIFRESDPSVPVYENVDNEYPIAIGRMIPMLGQFYGFGDGVILKPIQECVNNLTDELELAARFSAQTRIFVDPGAEIAPDAITSNPSNIISAIDPQRNIFQMQAGGVNSVVQQMIEFLMREAQKATRFNESMTGNIQGSSATATQINTNQAQGSVGIKDKKTDIALVMEWADMYALKLCMQYWDRPFWATISSDEKAEFVDMESISEVPSIVPRTGKTMMEQLENKIDVNSSKIPKFESATDENGNSIMTQLEFSTSVVIGESVPKGRTDMYNILLGLAQMQIMGEDGIPKPLITAKRLKALMEDVLGMKLSTEDEDNMENESLMNPEMMNQINPIGQGNTVQVPTATPYNLQQTVPQMPNQDSRSVQI